MKPGATVIWCIPCQEVAGVDKLGDIPGEPDAHFRALLSPDRPIEVRGDLVPQGQEEHESPEPAVGAGEGRRGPTCNVAERGATAGIVALVTDAVLHNPVDAEYEIAIDVAAALEKIRPGAGGQEFQRDLTALAKRVRLLHEAWIRLALDPDERGDGGPYDV